MKLTPAICVLILLLTAALAAPCQQASAPAFSVATIRASAPETNAPVTQIQGRRFVARGTTFVDLFKYAFDVHPSQVIGGPEWIRSQRFDVVADPETEARPSSDQFKVMLQQLLIARFHVSMHREQKVLPAFALERTNGPLKLMKTATPDPNGIPAVGYSPRGELNGANASLKDLAKFLQRFAVNRPIVDETGISGRFDFELRWTPENYHLNGELVDPSTNPNVPPVLFTAIQEQLGLKLKPTKAAVEVFVVDAVEKPSVD